jgi:hypothetical protein
MNAMNRIYAKQDQILYKKKGNKYVQANDVSVLDGLREGWYLVRVEDGCKSIYHSVYPAKAEILAAAKSKRDELVKIIREASEAKPKEGVPLSEQALKDWKHFVSKHGEEFNTLYYPSFHENADKIVEALLTK